MAFSTQTAVGPVALLDLTIDYLDRSEISVYYDALPVVEGVDWEWSGTIDKRILFTPPVTTGVEVLVKRTTPLANIRHEFSKGAAFTPETLDEDLKQVLRIAQEAAEGNLSGDFFADIDMHGNRVTNLGDALAPGDAVSFGQVTTLLDNAVASAEASADLAQQWAVQTASPVEGGLFGSKYYAEQALIVLTNTVQTNAPNTYTATQTYEAGAVYPNITAERALVIDATGEMRASPTTEAQMGYLSDVTSNIQAQLDSKFTSAGGNLTGPLGVNAEFLADGSTPAYRFLKRTVFTSSGTWTRDPRTRYWIAEIVGAGGGGGQAAAVNANTEFAMGSGGGGGGICILHSTLTPVSCVFTAGAGGASQTQGGLSTLTGTGVDMSVPGGAPGAGSGPIVGTGSFVFGGSNATPTGGTHNIIGRFGGPALSIGVNGTVMSGTGGNSPYGTGGSPAIIPGGSQTRMVGINGSGFGAGGSGGVTHANSTTTVAAAAGGAGGGSLCIITEYA